MPEQSFQISSREALLRALPGKAILFFFLLIGETLLLMYSPMVVGLIIDEFSAEYILWENYRIIIATMSASIMMVIAIRDKVPGAFWIGILAWRTLLFASILYLLSYAIKNGSTNEKV